MLKYFMRRHRLWLLAVAALYLLIVVMLAWLTTLGPVAAQGEDGLPIVEFHRTSAIERFLHWLGW
jgi:hypothetical protein